LVGFHEAGCATSGDEEVPQALPEHTRGDHGQVYLPGWPYVPEGDVVSGGEVERLARAQGGPDVLLVHDRGYLVGD
jgi:hypothetical protein